MVMVMDYLCQSLRMIYMSYLLLLPPQDKNDLFDICAARGF